MENKTSALQDEFINLTKELDNMMNCEDIREINISCDYIHRVLDHICDMKILAIERKGV